MNSRKTWIAAASCALLAFGVAACGDDENSSGGDAPTGIASTIRIDGSSTVAPLSEAIGEGFQQANPESRITVGTSGTGGGFEKFCAGETDISDASRAIEAEEEALCADGGVEYSELRVATDALTVVVNPENPVTCVTVDQLAAIWGPDTTATTWADVDGLDAAFDAELVRYGPGTDSGTFDYFTDAINGEEGAQTKDFNNVGENDNATVTGVSGDPGGIGYFGYSFYVENQDTLKALEVDSGDGCFAPTIESAQADEYTPLSRPLFMYPASTVTEDEGKVAFLQFYLDNVNSAAETLGFIPLTDDQLTESQDTLAALTG